MRGERNTDRKVRKFITVTNTKLWEQIEQIMTLPKYEKSFNRVINNALFYGLPELYAAEFGITTKGEKPKPQLQEKDITGDNCLNLVRLIKEVIINENINKSILCSLFQVKEFELGRTGLGEQFSTGYYQHTPAFISDYEIQELRKLRDKEDEL